MQKFNNDTGVRRLITISNMKVKEAKEYYHSLFFREPKEKQDKYTAELETRIKELLHKKETNEWILAIHTKEGKLIGKMEIHSHDSETASLKIEMPDEVKSYYYGVEAIKQFRKICEENHYFTRIELKSNNITERYKEAYNLETNFVEIKYA